MLRGLASPWVFVVALGSLLAAWQVPAHDSASSQLGSLLPSPPAAAGVAQGAPTFYGPDNLYQYMDGGADIFVLYGVRTLMHQDLRAGAVDVTADIFDMGSPDAAFGMYAAERSPEYKFLSLGAEGYRDTGILNFLQDRYYVKLAGFGQGADAVLEQMARAISIKIGTNPALPALLAKLPAEKRAPHSEQYIPKDPLGHPFLGPAYAVRYADGAEESQLYVTLARDGEDARDRLRQFQKHFASTGEWKDAPEAGPGVIRASNSFEGSVMARTQGRYLLILVHPSEAGAALLNSAAERLQ